MSSGKTEDMHSNLSLVLDELNNVNYLATNFLEFARVDLRSMPGALQIRDSTDDREADRDSESEGCP